MPNLECRLTPVIILSPELLHVFESIYLKKKESYLLFEIKCYNWPKLLQQTNPFKSQRRTSSFWPGEGRLACVQPSTMALHLCLQLSCSLQPLFYASKSQTWHFWWFVIYIWCPNVAVVEGFFSRMYISFNANCGYLFCWCQRLCHWLKVDIYSRKI